MALKSRKEANRKTVLVSSLVFVVIIGIIASFYYAPGAVNSNSNQALAGQAYVGLGTATNDPACTTPISSFITRLNPNTGQFEPTSTVPMQACCQTGSCVLNQGASGCYSEGLEPTGQIFCTLSGNWEACTTPATGLFQTDSNGQQFFCDGTAWQTCNPNVNPTTLLFNRLGSDSEYYTFPFQNHGCYNVDLYTQNPFASPPVYSGLYLCDQGTQAVADRATLCQNGVALPPIESLSVLRNANRNPTTTQGITLIYNQPSTSTTSKQVDAVLTTPLAVDNPGSQFPLGTFSQNLIQGQSLLFVLENQYYELTHASGQTLFSLDQLQLRHIPRLTTYTAQQYAGTNSYIFNVENGRTIIVTITQGQVNVRAGRVGEAPANFVTPFNLEQNHEVQITLNAPVDITTPTTNPIGQLTICRQDNPADLQQLLLCNDRGSGSQTLASLPRDVLTVIPIATIGFPTTDYAFLYQYDGNEKKVSIFTLTDLANAQSLLNYNDFINAMIAGRRKAVRFQNNVYLLEHPQQSTISLQNINLVHYAASGMTTIPATGSEDIAHFSTLSGGRITIQRNYGVPPPPFQVSALTRQQVVDTPVNLDGQLFVSMSSQTPVRITGPQNEGVVAVAQNDLPTFQPTFQIDVGGTPVTLNYQQPLERGPYLYYYDNIQINGATPIKTASIYRLYDLLDLGPVPSLTTPTRSFDTDFINNLTSGNQLAFTFPSSTNTPVYYLLGYASQNSQAQIFDLQQLQLSSLDGSQTFTPTLSSDATSTIATFLLPEGEVKVRIPLGNQPNRLIFFQLTTDANRNTQAFVNQNSFTLTTSNSVFINNQQFQLCNQQIYRDLTAANVCWGTTATQQLVVDGNEYLILAGQEYILESNGLTRENKQVTIRKVTRIDQANPTYGPTNWTAFTEQVINNDVPIFNISGALYQPVAQDSLLQNFAMQSYPAGQLTTAQNVQSQSPILSSGTLSLGSSLLDISQSLNGPINQRTVDATFTLRPYQVIPVDGSSIIQNITQRTTVPVPLTTFVTTATGNQYRAELTQTPANLVRIRITDITSIPNRIVIDRLFAEGNTRTLTLDGQQVQIIVRTINEDATNYYAEVIFKR